MKIQREDSARTKERLIAAASEVFAKKDYRAATIAEICKRAGANLAAVNYHFGDKETLYREAWRYAFQTGVKAHPINGGGGDGVGPEERLRALIRTFLLRITDENDREFLIVHREMSNPTGLLEEVMERELLPMNRRMEAIIDELLGPSSSAELVRYCAISIMNQCLHPVLKRTSDVGTRDSYLLHLDMERFIDHTVDFSLGGIKAVADVARKKAPAGKAESKPRRKKGGLPRK